MDCVERLQNSFNCGICCDLHYKALFSFCHVEHAYHEKIYLSAMKIKASLNCGLLKDMRLILEILISTICSTVLDA